MLYRYFNYKNIFIIFIYKVKEEVKKKREKEIV